MQDKSQLHGNKMSEDPGRRKLILPSIMLLFVVAAGIIVVVLFVDDSRSRDAVEVPPESPTVAPTLMLQAADVRINVATVSTEMDEETESAYADECADFFAEHLTDFTNVQATVASQELRLAARRKLQVDSNDDRSYALSTRVQVTGRSADSELTTEALQAVIEANGDGLVESLVALDNDYFSSLQTIAALDPDHTETPSMTPSLYPTIHPTKKPIPPILEPPPPTLSPVPPRRCNGLASLCFVPANQAFYATVHNAMASMQDGFLTAHHDLSGAPAPGAGYRALHLQWGRCDGAIRLVDGSCSEGSADPIPFFTTIVNDFFVMRNRNEVLLLLFQVQASNSDDETPLTLAEIQGVLGQVEGLTDKFHSHTNATAPWPTLGELIDEEHPILLFYDGPSCESDCPSTFHDWSLYAAETQQVFETVDQLANTTSSCSIVRGNADADFFAVHVHLQPPDRDVQMTLNEENALLEHVQACERVASRTVNFVFLDYWTLGGAPDVALQVNADRFGLP